MRARRTRSLLPSLEPEVVCASRGRSWWRRWGRETKSHTVETAGEQRHTFCQSVVLLRVFLDGGMGEGRTRGHPRIIIVLQCLLQMHQNVILVDKTVRYVQFFNWCLEGNRSLIAG